MQSLKRHGRFLVAFLSLTIAFVLSIQFSDRGVQFDLRHSVVSASEGGAEAYELSSLKILNRVLLQLKDNYVEPERIHPNKMLVSALEAIQHAIPEVVVEHRSGEEIPKSIDVSVGAKSQTFDVRGIESLWEMSFRLKEIFLFIEQNLEPHEDLKYQDVEYAAINGLLTTLDPHSTLLPPAHYEEMQTQTGGRFGGLGIVISVRDGQLTVISPIDGTPAAQKGIKAQDTIVRIGEESTINMSLNEAVNMLRGEPGTDVDLWLLRKPWTEPRQFTVTRAIIKIDSVDSQVLANKVGYIRIKNFQANTTTDLRSHLNKLREKMGGIQGVVLDMRDNPGGLLDQSIRVSDLFLDEGTIVSTVGVGNKLRETKKSSRAGTEPKYPIIVLVNAGSASASEIVAGALQNNDRAIVMGDTTFGKGTVQILYEFPDSSALKLTVAQYLTPGDISIQSRGIVPDLRTIPVRLRKSGQVDMFLSQNVVREQDLDSSFINASEQTRSGEVDYVRYLRADPDDDEEDADEFVDPNVFKEDFEIRLAQQLLVASGKDWKRSSLLTSLQDELVKVYDGELAKIEVELKKLGVDWSEGVSNKNPDVTMSLKTDRDMDTINAGDKVTLTATLHNNGDTPLYRVKALTRSDNPVLRDREFLFGKVEPGKSKEWSLEVTMPKDTTSRHDRIHFVLSDAGHEYGGSHALDLKTVGHNRPHFAFSYEILDGNGDGLLQKDEEVTFRLFVQNVGSAASEETTAALKNLTRESIYLNKGRVKLGSIKPNETAQAEFSFTVKNPPTEPVVELEVDIYDLTFREFVQKKISIPYSSTAGKVDAVTGTAKVKTGPAKLFTGASTQTDTVALVPAETALVVSGRLNDWIKLDLGSRSAWIQANLVDFTPGKAGKATELAETTSFQKPRVVLTPSTMMTSTASISLAGAINDDVSIKDYYIFVFNQNEDNAAKYNTRKLNYVRVDSQEADIKADVPLFAGMNRISVITRNEAGMTTTESIYVYRKQ